MQSKHRNKPNAERKAGRLRRTGYPNARAKKVNGKWVVNY